MANIMVNRVNAILDPIRETVIYQCIDEMLGQLPELDMLTLTAGERGSIAAIDVANKAFVEDTINELRSNGTQMMPVSIQADQIQNDLKLFEQMDIVHSKLKNLIQRVSDLRRIAASEAMGASNTAYGIYGISAQAGIPAAQASYDKLKARYQRISTVATATPLEPEA